MTRTYPAAAFGALAAAALLLTACGSATTPSGTPSGGSGSGAKIAVVASTDVWGHIVSAIGGDHVQVTALMSDPSADPHSYEASAQNQLTISKAAVIVENGGGYDDVVDRMISSADAKATVLNAVALSGRTAVDGELNEHVWYDFRAVDKVAAKIQSVLAAADPADATTFADNAKVFTGKIAELQKKEAAIKAKHAGVGVAITEPVPLYMLEAAGLVNKTPAAFSEAVESDSDAPAAVVAQNRALFTGKKVRALIYNEQTTGPQTEQVLAVAKANGIPVVPVTETLPSGADYLGWMNANLDAIAAALN